MRSGARSLIPRSRTTLTVLPMRMVKRKGGEDKCDHERVVCAQVSSVRPSNTLVYVCGRTSARPGLCLRIGACATDVERYYVLASEARAIDVERYYVLA